MSHKLPESSPKNVRNGRLVHLALAYITLRPGFLRQRVAGEQYHTIRDFPIIFQPTIILYAR